MSTAPAEYNNWGGSERELALSEARARFSELVNRARYAGDSVYVTQHGRRVAAIVPAELLAELEEAEDRADAAAIERVRAGGGEWLDWEDAKRELGF